jgi:hypothetical protein
MTDPRDATIAAPQSEIARMRDALKSISEGRGKCQTCGEPCVGDGAGYTACECARPTWTEHSPVEKARAALSAPDVTRREE